MCMYKGGYHGIGPSISTRCRWWQGLCISSMRHLLSILFSVPNRVAVFLEAPSLQAAGVFNLGIVPIEL